MYESNDDVWPDAPTIKSETVRPSEATEDEKDALIKTSTLPLPPASSTELTRLTVKEEEPKILASPPLELPIIMVPDVLETRESIFHQCMQHQAYNLILWLTTASLFSVAAAIFSIYLDMAEAHCTTYVITFPLVRIFFGLYIFFSVWVRLAAAVRNGSIRTTMELQQALRARLVEVLICTILVIGLDVLATLWPAVDHPTRSCWFRNFPRVCMYVGNIVEIVCFTFMGIKTSNALNRLL